MRGTLALTFSPTIDSADLVGSMFDLFDWNAALEPTNAFDLIQLPDNTTWDLSGLYLTGEVVLTELRLGLLTGDADRDLDQHRVGLRHLHRQSG